MSLSHQLRWDGVSPSALSQQCTRIHSVHSISQNSQNVYGEISISILRNVNSLEKQQMSIRNVLSYTSSWSHYTSYTLRSVFALFTSISNRLTFKVLSEDSETLKETLADLRITLKASAYKMDVRPLLKVVLEAFFGPSVGLVDMITEFVPSPLENAALKVSPLYYKWARLMIRSVIRILDP